LAFQKGPLEVGLVPKVELVAKVGLVPEAVEVGLEP
jgi:hypothetical protein